MTNYTIEGTTKRYQRNCNCTYPDFTPNQNDLYLFGCEFEFYIDTTRYTVSEAIESLTQNLYLLTHADILVDEISVPNSTDKNHCMQIKPDISLEDNGIEISVPISTKAGIVHFIQNISPLIAKYGYTNKETGFHIHMSTRQKSSSHIDFYRFMILCDHANLLSSWKPREGYSQNVMDILSTHPKHDARVIKTKKGTVWNLEKIDTHHIEIKSIGGRNYHLETERIIKEFEAYTDYFAQATGAMTDAHKRLLQVHKKRVDTLSKQKKSDFANALHEAGILDTRTS